jgi:hypothetical protein
MSNILSQVATGLGTTVFVQGPSVFSVTTQPVPNGRLVEPDLREKFTSQCATGEVAFFLHRLKQGELNGLRGGHEKNLEIAESLNLLPKPKPDLRESVKPFIHGDAVDFMTCLASALGAACCFAEKDALHALVFSQVPFSQFVDYSGLKEDPAKLFALLEKISAGELNGSYAPAASQPRQSQKESPRSSLTQPQSMPRLAMEGFSDEEIAKITPARFDHAIQIALDRTPRKGDALWLTTGKYGLWVSRIIPKNRSGYTNIRLAIRYNGKSWQFCVSEARGTGAITLMARILSKTKWPLVLDATQPHYLRKEGTKEAWAALKRAERARQRSFVVQ